MHDEAPVQIQWRKFFKDKCFTCLFSINFHLRPLKLPCNVSIEGFRFQRTHKLTSKQVLSVYLGMMIENILKSNLSAQYPSIEK